MNRLYLCCIISAFLWVFFITSCADDLRNRNAFDDGVGDTVISFSVENVSQTRTEGSVRMETMIDHAYLLFYDSGASLETDVPLAAVRGEVSETDPSALSFKMPMRLKPGTDYRLLALANADFYVPDGYANFADYVRSWCAADTDVREYLHFFKAGRILADRVSCLPMRGSVVDNGYFRFTTGDNGCFQVSASLSFRRMVARIDLTNNAGSGFVVEGVTVCNWRDAIPVNTEGSGPDDRFGTIRGVLSDDGDGTGADVFVRVPDADENGRQQLRESIYCFPSVCHDSYSSDRQSTALIIKAKYKDDTESSYYRVNLGVAGNKSLIKANTRYTVNIQSVNGRGASTPEDAYMSRESLIRLSVIEDWDLDVGGFAMDDDGNFIILSTCRLEFDGEPTEIREVRILSSGNLTLDVRYIADGDDSKYPFIASLQPGNPVSTLTVSTADKNSGDDVLSGKFVITAHSPEGGSLSVDLYVCQKSTSGDTEDNVIPDGMPFALIPQSFDHVRIDHVRKEIEIDGFDPDCFNSFIDIPFKVYVDGTTGDGVPVGISSSLEWPLEGRISRDRSDVYTYCKESFSEQKKQKVSRNGDLILCSQIGNKAISIINADTDVFYISVGAMGPDDPAIQREVILSGEEKTVTYSLTVRPRKAIVDDVVIWHDDRFWMIMDRNVQSTSADWINYAYVGRDADGKKRQAYNYCDKTLITVPFKFLDDGRTAFSENQHQLYKGEEVSYSKRSGLANKRLNWLGKYRCSEEADVSPGFYNNDNYNKWIFPDSGLIEACCAKMRMSKMRMYLLSEISARENDTDIPVCCYWPYIGDGPDVNAWPRYGYFTAQEGSSGERAGSILFIHYDGTEVKAYKWSVLNDDVGLSRLVRPLSDDELDDYKTSCLGYGSGPHRLSICHPDTYDSAPVGWLPN